MASLGLSGLALRFGGRGLHHLDRLFLRRGLGEPAGLSRCRVCPESGTACGAGMAIPRPATTESASCAPEGVWRLVRRAHPGSAVSSSERSCGSRRGWPHSRPVSWHRGQVALRASKLFAVDGGVRSRAGTLLSGGWGAARPDHQTMIQHGQGRCGGNRKVMEGGPELAGLTAPWRVGLRRSG